MRTKRDILSTVLAGSMCSKNDWHPMRLPPVVNCILSLMRFDFLDLQEFCKLAVKWLLAWWEYLRPRNQQMLQSRAFLLGEPIVKHLPEYHWLVPFDRWDSERLSNLPKVTQQVKDRNEMWTPCFIISSLGPFYSFASINIKYCAIFTAIHSFI